MKLKKKKFNSIRLYYIIILYNISRISFIFFLREIFFNSIIDNNFSLSLFQFSIDLRNSFLCYEWIKFIFSNVPTCLLQRVLKKITFNVPLLISFFPFSKLGIEQIRFPSNRKIEIEEISFFHYERKERKGEKKMESECRINARTLSTSFVSVSGYWLLF